MDVPARLVDALGTAMTAAVDPAPSLQAWLDAGRAGGLDGLRVRLEKVADPAPVAEAVEALRAAGRQAAR